MLANKPMQAVGHLQGSQVNALHVFNQRHGLHLPVCRLSNERWYSCHSRLLRGPPAPFAGNEFIAAPRCGTKQNGLQQSLLANRVCERVELVRVKVPSRLRAASANELDGNLSQPALKCFSGFARAEQGVKASAEPSLRGIHKLRRLNSAANAW